MKKIKEVRQRLDDIISLVELMESEIKLLRNLLYRSYLLNGNEIKGGHVEVPETIYFSSFKRFDKEELRVNDTDTLKVTSNYQQIKKILEELK